MTTDYAAEQFAVSRAVVREAIRVLESMGLVRVRRRLGVTVLGVEHWNSLDTSIVRWQLEGIGAVEHLNYLNELRLAIEPIAARFAAARATPAQCGALTGAAIGLATTAKLAATDAYAAHDLEFHNLLFTAASNPLFASLSKVIATGPTEQTNRALMRCPVDDETTHRHAMVASSIQRGDPEGAERVMREVFHVAVNHR